MLVFSEGVPCRIRNSTWHRLQDQATLQHCIERRDQLDIGFVIGLICGRDLGHVEHLYLAGASNKADLPYDKARLDTFICNSSPFVPGD